MHAAHTLGDGQVTVLLVMDSHGWAAWVQRRVRDARAGYFQSLEVLRAAKAEGVYTKSSLMLGLGETDDEIIDAMLDLRAAGGRSTPGCCLCCARHGLKTRSASNS